MRSKIGCYPRGTLFTGPCLPDLLPALLAVCATSQLWCATPGLAATGPFPTGTHPQLVRKFHTMADGLPADEVRAVAATRDGAVFAASAKGLARLHGERWVPEAGPSNVTALFALPQEVAALAGAGDGVWALTQGEWRKEEGSPAGVIAFAAEPAGVCWALARGGVWRREPAWRQVHRIDEDDMVAPKSLLAFGPEEAFVASESGLFGLMGKRKYWLSLEVRPGGLLSHNTRALARLGDGHLLIATDKGLNLSNGKNGWVAVTGADGLPILDLTGAAVAVDGTIWLGSDHGLMRWRGGQWTYLAGKRWLPHERVAAMAPAPDGSVWVGTTNGLSQISERRMTLAEKADIYQRDLESRNRRHGFVTVLQLPAPGVLEGAVQEVSDNDGLWTALYIASQSFRFAVTKAPEAKAQAWRSMQALLRLESITGLTGFPARAICHVDEPQFDHRSLRSHSEWHESPSEKGWFWKGETSSDELDGHYFGWFVFHELAADEEQKARVRATCQRVTDHILNNGFYLLDIDGRPTTWGVWAPEKLNDDPKWWEERGLNSVEILSHLKVASHIVGDARYDAAYRELIRKHHYALNTLRAKLPDGVSHDDQLLFLAYYPLLQLEKDPAMRAMFTSSLRRTWEMERREANPLWNFIFGASTGQPCDAEATVQSLRDFPLDFILWETRNSHRADLVFDPVLEQRGIKRLSRPLPFTERLLHKWDKDPYDLDGGNDRGEVDQTAWLLPYWMGRYHGLIE
jgi:hypothetical protein